MFVAASSSPLECRANKGEHGGGTSGHPASNRHVGANRVVVVAMFPAPTNPPAQTFSWQEERTMSRNLTVHFKRVTYLVEPGPETLPLGGKRVIVREWEDGRVEIQCAGRTLPYSIFDKNPHVAAGAIVENKRLGAVLAVIQGCPGRTGPDPIGLEEADASAE